MTIDEEAESSPGEVVVGVDGSEHSRRALSWAARYAKLSGAVLKVITTWGIPLGYGYEMPWPKDADFSVGARTALQESIAAVLGDEPGIEVVSEVVEGHPAVVLEEASRSAALLVVGSRGHGEFLGMLLGSVSEHVATHAHCPVVVIRYDETRTASR